MDPVSALGVAAASVQFLDALVKAYKAFQEIRSNAGSTTERNKRLERSIRAAQTNLRDIQVLRASLTSSSTSRGINSPVPELTTSLISKAGEILSLLEYVRGSNESISAVRATIRALRKGKQIEQLYRALQEEQGTLDNVVQQSIPLSIDILAMQHSKEFTNLNTMAQEHVLQLVKQRQVQEAHSTRMISELDGIKRDAELRQNESNRTERRKELYASLWFPEIDQRRREIKEPAPNTLNWLFESEDKDGNQLNWPSFKEWLREDTSMYWISGKAGSGKSTLMAHIVNDHRTRRELDTWRNGNELVILSFFFWRAGSELQKSITGLLRSLLYQLCYLRPAVADDVISYLASPAGIPTWTERELLYYISKAIKSAQNSRFCLFIDGLDEYKDQRDTLDELVDHLNRLQNLSNVKVCVSSRPELELVRRFQGLKRLRLQDLNYNDIETFVGQVLSKTGIISDKDCIHLVREVVERSDGVFLWAALVTQSLKKGLIAGDRPDVTQKRLELLPKDMDSLFAKMLSDVDEVHRNLLAYYVRLLMVNPSSNMTRAGLIGARTALTNIPAIVMGQVHEGTLSYEEFAKECQRTESQIISSSAGLIEIEDGHSDRTIDLIKWQSTARKFVSNKPQLILKSRYPTRRKCTESEAYPYPAMLKYENRYINWIHRSAFDFFSDPDNFNVLREINPVHRELLPRFIENYLDYIAAASSIDFTQSIDGWATTLTNERFHSLFDVVSIWYSEDPVLASAFLDKLHSILLVQGVVDELRNDTIPSIFKWIPSLDTAEVYFWSLCARFPLSPYILSRMDHIQNTGPDFLVAHLLAYLWRNSAYHTTFDGDISAAYSVLDDRLVEILSQRRIERLEMNDATERRFIKSQLMTPPAFRWHKEFDCASWKEPVAHESMLMMIRLICALGSSFSSFGGKLIPTSLLVFFESTELYMASNFGLDRLYVELSARTLIAFHQLGLLFKPRISLEDIRSAILTTRAVRIVCVPLLARRKVKESPDPDPSSPIPSWVPLTKPEYSQSIFIYPSMEASAQLLGLLTQNARDDLSPYRDPKQQQEVCKMLLQEIKCAGSNLDGGQQLIAAACAFNFLVDHVEDGGG
ncbi:hypothetical protein F4777DRAFT_581506 [Nemania sp. FL0916]|nr:hypothetical protein F4777DRAFT_581506 [Nemania sp. FL0916]